MSGFIYLVTTLLTYAHHVTFELTWHTFWLFFAFCLWYVALFGYVFAFFNAMCEYLMKSVLFQAE